MPKRTIVQSENETETYPTALPGWCATGLSVAVISGAAFSGVGALCAALIAAVVIYALARLHRHAPQSPSTGDLVTSTLGPKAGRITSLLQLIAYAVLAGTSAVALGFLPLLGASDPDTAVGGWQWPVWSAAVVLAAATLVSLLPTRIVGAAAGGLAAVGLLVFFYIALAVVAKVASGTEPVLGGVPEFPQTLLLVAVLIPLGFGLTGFESPMTVSRRLQSVWRPLAAAVAVTVLCAATLLLAVNMATLRGGFHYDARDLSLVAEEFFGAPGRYWTIAGAACLGAAAMLAVTWAAARVCGRLFGTGRITTIILPSVICVLAVALCLLQLGVGRVPLLIAGVLLLVTYVLVTEANSRVDGSAAATQVPRVVTALALAGAVLIPLRAHFASPWPVGVTAAVLAVAALLARRSELRWRSLQPH